MPGLRPSIPPRTLDYEPRGLPPPPRSYPAIRGKPNQVSWARQVRDDLSSGIHREVERLQNDPRGREELKRLAGLVRRFLFWMDDAAFWIDSRELTGRELVEWLMMESTFLKAADRWKEQEAGRDDDTADGWNRIQGRLDRPGEDRRDEDY